MVGFPGLLGDLVQMAGDPGHGAGDLFPQHVALAGRQVGQGQRHLERGGPDLAAPVGGGHGADIAGAGLDRLGFRRGAGGEITLLDVFHGGGDPAGLRFVHGGKLGKLRLGGGHLSGQVDHLDRERLHRVQFAMGDARDDEGAAYGAVGAGAPRPSREFRRFESDRRRRCRAAGPNAAGPFPQAAAG